jgi:hypothetical protein
MRIVARYVAMQKYNNNNGRKARERDRKKNFMSHFNELKFAIKNNDDNHEKILHTVKYRIK